MTGADREPAPGRGDRPDAVELIDTVAEYLAERARPALDGHPAFEAAVAASLLGIACRELELGPQAREAEQARLLALTGQRGSLEEVEADLARRIRSGELDIDADELRSHLRATAADRLRVANPAYLPSD